MVGNTVNVEDQYYQAKLNYSYFFFVQDLPSSIGKLSDLSVLNVDRNQLQILPVEVSIME